MRVTRKDYEESLNKPFDNGGMTYGSVEPTGMPTKPTTEPQGTEPQAKDISNVYNIPSANDYLEQIKMNKMNARSELSNAQQKSNMLMNNYLKALGIGGSGLGQSAIAQNNMAYANKIAESDRYYDEQDLNVRQKQQDKIDTMADNLLNAGVDSKSFSNFTNNPTIQNYYDILGQLNQKTINDENNEAKSSVLQNVTDMLNTEGITNKERRELELLRDTVYKEKVNSDKYKEAVEAIYKNELGMDTSKEISDLGGTKGIGQLAEDYANSIRNKYSNEIEEQTRLKNQLQRGNVVDKNNPIYEAFNSQLEKSNSTNTGRRKGYVEVKFNGHTYTISKNDGKILAIDYVY